MRNYSLWVCDVLRVVVCRKQRVSQSLNVPAKMRFDLAVLSVAELYFSHFPLFLTIFLL
jgi:hypothetical protein